MSIVGCRRFSVFQHCMPAAMFCVLVGLEACGTGHSALVGASTLPDIAANRSNDTPNVASTSDNTPVLVGLNYTLPTSGISAKAFAAKSTTYRRPEYISTSNTLISITVTPIGGTSTTYGPNSCTSTVCSINFTAVPGPTAIAFSLTDGSSNVLSNFSTTTIVQPATLNTLNFTANPVVNSVALQLASGATNAGIPANDLLTVEAKDADGNTIVGNANYVDINGNPVAFALDVTNIQAGGKGTVTVQGPTYITAPGQNSISAHYDGNWLSSSTISITSTSSAVASLTNATFTATPYNTEYSAGITAAAKPLEIIAGPDGNLWFTEFSGNRIGRITPSGTVTEFSTGITAGADPLGITIGADGNLWFTEDLGNRIGRITPSGVVTEFSTGITAGSYLTDITNGPDGNLWFTESTGNRIGRITLSGVVTEFSTGISTGADPFRITSGPDGNIWFTESGTNSIGRITTSGTVTEFTAGITAAASLFYITSGPDGNLWFTEKSGNRIGRITPSGTVTEFSAGMTAAAQPYNIRGGPDGNLWFTENSGNSIGRITMSGVISEFSAGITAASQPYGITIGPDGNMWFTEASGNRLGKFVL